MSRFLRANEGDAPASPPSYDTGASEALTAFIDQGSEFEGKLSFKNTVRIDGTFKGEISSENTLIVGEPGAVNATIRSRHVIVSGTVEGDVIASEKLVLHKTAHVVGDVQTPKLVVEEGAKLEGTLRMGGGSDAGKTKSASKPNGQAQGKAEGPNPTTPPA